MAARTPEAGAAALQGQAAAISQPPRRLGLALAVIATAQHMVVLDIALCVGTALLGMFFFLTLFIQDVGGYSPLKTGLAYLPFVRITEHSTFADGMLGPELLLGAGLGPLFVLIFLAELTKVRNNDTGVASSLVNVGQQVGGAIGLAIVGTVAWSTVASSLRSQAAAAARAGVHASGTRAALQTQIYHHALATGFSRSYLVSAGILVLAAIITLAVVRIRRPDLAGTYPAPVPPSDAASPNPA